MSIFGVNASLAEMNDNLPRRPASVRLDPFTLPQRFRYDTGTDPRDGRPLGQATVSLDARCAEVRRTLPSGVPMTLKLPMSAFEGVAVRFLPDRVGPHGETIEDGRVVIELLHRDPQLSLPLSVAEDVADVAADWRAWARVLGRPMLIVEADGSWQAVETRLGSVIVKPPRPRRQRSVLVGRRPRFLARRKPAKLSVRPTVFEKRELFGRD
jgi:hypothetical protein